MQFSPVERFSPSPKGLRSIGRSPLRTDCNVSVDEDDDGFLEMMDDGDVDDVEQVGLFVKSRV